MLVSNQTISQILILVLRRLHPVRFFIVQTNGDPMTSASSEDIDHWNARKLPGRFGFPACAGAITAALQHPWPCKRIDM